MYEIVVNGQMLKILSILFFIFSINIEVYKWKLINANLIQQKYVFFYIPIAFQEHKAELSARREMFSKLEKQGLNLLAEKHSQSERIQSEIDKTSEIQENVKQSWERTKQLLLQGNQLHSFRQQHLRASSWLEEKEAVLNNDDLGDSLAAVEALVRKHEGFITTTNKQSKVHNCMVGWPMVRFYASSLFLENGRKVRTLILYLCGEGRDDYR